MESFFNSVNNVPQQQLAQTVLRWYNSLTSTSHLDGKVVRRLTSLVLYQGYSVQTDKSRKEEALNFLDERFEAICSMEPLLGTYFTAWVTQDESALEQLRRDLLGFSIESDRFRAQRYIHTAAIDLRDWKTASLLHAKFSQTVKM